MINSTKIKNQFKSLQQKIVQTVELVDHKKFLQDTWNRPEGGGGITCILENGSIFERAGIGFSHVFGKKLPPSASVAHPEIINSKWEAMGVSLVFHPFNPFIPTVHLNIRFFIASPVKNADEIWWFGGGTDLTPYYPFKEDVVHFHQTLKDGLDKYGKDLYPKYKKQCDDYFFLPHRNEPRGVGGIFFDDENQLGFEKTSNMVFEVGDMFLNAYMPIVQKRISHKFKQEHKDFQHYRRGRYVEFNLLQDRGTLFGIQSRGRTESILMSMPPHVTWSYDYQPKKGSLEEILYKEFLMPKEWLE
jgi:coproporphyrinogen III oxidase